MSNILDKIKPQLRGFIYYFFAINYLFITYIVTSKPKRISVADGFVHMMKSPISLYT